jgi:hypothetical protein
MALMQRSSGMAKTGDGYSTSTYFWGQNGTGGGSARGDIVDKERDAKVGWTKGGRLKITKSTEPKSVQKKQD